MTSTTKLLFFTFRGGHISTMFKKDYRSFKEPSAFLWGAEIAWLLFSWHVIVHLSSKSTLVLRRFIILDDYKSFKQNFSMTYDLYCMRDACLTIDITLYSSLTVREASFVNFTIIVVIFPVCMQWKALLIVSSSVLVPMTTYRRQSVRFFYSMLYKTFWKGPFQAN